MTIIEKTIKRKKEMKNKDGKKLKINSGEQRYISKKPIFFRFQEEIEKKELGK